MAIKFTNNAVSTLSVGINNSQTSITLSSGGGALFPTLGASDWFYATIVDGSGNLEIVKVTARSTDTLTVTRAQEGTTARAFIAGCRIELRLTAQGISDATPKASSAAEVLAGTSADTFVSPLTLASSGASGGGAGESLYLYDLFGRL